MIETKGRPIRLLRSLIVIGGVFASASTASAQTIGANMATYLKSALNTRVGGGECSQMATEALRVSGGEFVASDLGADSPSTGDYLWGTLVTVISYSNKTWSDSNKTNLCLVGDVIQYNSAVFTYSTGTVSASHHTAVVAAVNTAGRPTSIYQQNFNNVRTVQQATIDTTKLTAGWIRIYRPIPLVVRTNEWKMTVCNNTTATQTYTANVGTAVLGTVSLSAANTANSFIVHRIDTSGTVPDLVLPNGTSLFLTTKKGNAIVSTTAGLSFQQLAK